MEIRIDGKKYKMPLAWGEIKVKNYSKVLEYWGNINPEVRNKIKKGDDLDEETQFNFLIGWVNSLIGVDIDVLKRVDFDDLQTIWMATNYLLGAPDTFLRLYKLNGVEITESITTASGMEMLGAGASYEQWTLLNQLAQMMVQEADVKNIENLKRFLSVLYPVKNESQAQLSKRMAELDNISALELWSGWFFFAKWINGWASFTQYLKKNQKTKKGEILKAKLARLQIWHAFADSKIGKFLRMKSPKQAYWDLITKA